MNNPFEITKASDFNDTEISEYLVDGWGTSTFEEVLKPTQPMPKVLSGGKGSGKTHLMRMLSFSAKKQGRTQAELQSKVKEDGYLGVYVRCDALNGTRFSGKGKSQEDWFVVFCFSMELVMAVLALEAISTCVDTSSPESRLFIAAVAELFSKSPPASLSSFEELLQYLKELSKSADYAVANAYRQERLEVDIVFGPGALAFGIPIAFAECFPAYSQLRFLYLIDEVENLSESQQWFLQALIRDRKDPSSVILGGRCYGIRTYRIGPNGEENRPGSEFEAISLDSLFREKENEYRSFMHQVVQKRLMLKGYRECNLQIAFEKEDSADQFRAESVELVKKWDERGEDRLWIKELKTFVARQLRLAEASGRIDDLVFSLECPSNPVLEKVNILSYYHSTKGVHAEEDAKRIAADIGAACSQFLDGVGPKWYKQKVSHFGIDMYAQVRRACSAPQQYLGFDSFLSMSEGLPRNLLTILKYIFDWAHFYGEEPFRGQLISKKAQQLGVSQAADWFFKDVRDAGPDGVSCRKTVDRVSRLLRIHRYSAKPVEKSVSSFSVDRTVLSELSRRHLQVAQDWSLIISGGEQRVRNGMGVTDQFQVSGMIAPKWDLPIVKGGTIQLSSEEAEVIFDGSGDDVRFEQVASQWRTRYSPQAQSKPTKVRGTQVQPSLIDHEETNEAV